jgi:AAA domain
MTYSFRPARRSEAKPLIGLYAESGAGKTYSALLLARGFVGPTGRIGMIETESGRGEAYADIIPGGYEVLSIRDNFSPANYGAAIKAAEEAKYDALIIDSASHEWEGAGGVLAMAAANQSSGKTGVLVWQQPKLEHQRNFMLKLMATPIPLVVVAMRAKHPMVQITKDGKKEWIRSADLEPKQADDILFEMFVHGWIDQQHKLHVTKYSREDLRDVIKDNEPITLETGTRVAAWAGGAPVASHRPEKSAPPRSEQSRSNLNEGEGATDPDPGQAVRLANLDADLAKAARDGMTALQAKWKTIDPADQKLLKASLDKRHKPAAQEADIPA